MAARINELAERRSIEADTVAEALVWLKKGAAADELAAEWWAKVGVRYIPTSLRDELLEKPCAYCGTEYSTDVDHVIPVSQGGLSERDNLAPACFRCNHEKSGMTPAEWRDARLGSGSSWPPADRSKEAKTILASRMNALLEDPEFLAEVSALEATFARPDNPPLDYATDPRWLAADMIRDDCDHATTDGLVRYRAATELLFRVEFEYEQCRHCRGTGRRKDGGIGRRCSCPAGRAMADADLSAKAAEEACA